MTQLEKTQLILLHRLWKANSLNKKQYKEYEILLNKYYLTKGE